MAKPQKLTKLLQLMGLPNEPRVGTGHEYGIGNSAHDLQDCAAADWDAVARRIESHPEEAAVPIQCRELSFGRVSSCEYSPLAAALKNETNPVPQNVVEALVQAYPKAMDVDTALKDERISAKALRVLLSFWSPKDSEIRGSLRWMVCEHAKRVEHIRALIEASPGSLCAASRHDDRSPIELALCVYLQDMPLRTSQLLLAEGVKQQVGGRYGAGGLLVFCKKDVLDYLHRRRTVLQLVVKEAARLKMEGRMTDDHRDILMECFKVAGAAKAKLDRADEYPPIHGAIMCAPLALTIDLIDERIPDFYTAVDPLGRTALHVALMAARRSVKGEDPDILKDTAKWRDFMQKYLIDLDDGKAARTRDRDGNLPLHVATEVDALTIGLGLGNLVKVYPEAAKCCNNRGELPLHIAIKEGIMGRENGLDCIMAACPRAAICRDAKTGMYPFMLAACAPNFSSVDTIYMMLREDPAVVQGGIRPSSQEQYLCKKLDNERVEWQRKETKHQEERGEWQRKEVEYQKEIASLKKELLGMVSGKGEKKVRKRAREIIAGDY